MEDVMDFWTDKMILPLLVALIGGLVTYWAKLSRERDALRTGLLSEINFLLRQTEEFKDYLSLEGHPWHQVGETLRESPVFVATPRKIFAAMLPSLWLLSRNELDKVLQFYNHLEDCEKLLEILFGRIKKLEDAGKPLDSDQVSHMKKRTHRIIRGFESVLHDCNLPVKKLSDLPGNYKLPSAEETARNLGISFKKAAGHS